MEDIVHGVFAAEQQQVARRLGEVLDAVGTKDFQRLARYHLNSPKFSKFNDNAPLERQGVDLSNRIEQDELGSVDNFDGEFGDLKIDVFGPLAITTSIFRYTFEADGQADAAAIRATLIFVNSGGEWLIAHEHLSPYTAGS